MKIKIEYSNEIPFMIQLPNACYNVLTNFAGEEKTVALELMDDIYRLNVNQFANEYTGFYYDGNRDDLEKLISKKGISIYSIEKLKSYIKYFVEEEVFFNEEDYNISKDDFIGRLKTLILTNKNIKSNLSQDELSDLAEKEYIRIQKDDNILKQYKDDYLIAKKVNAIRSSHIYFYYEALNKFIKSYSYIRNDIFVETLTTHNLKGTFQRAYIDDTYYDEVKFAGKIPSIMPNSKWMPDIHESDLNKLNNLLSSVSSIPHESELIIVAKSLLERGEFRSSIIEVSAALEIAIENKLIEVMKISNRTEKQIESFLKCSETKFAFRCNVQLDICYGVSFSRDNSELWKKIESHRKNYRHKIVHSTERPNAKETEEVIKDFEKAIMFINGL